MPIKSRLLRVAALAALALPLAPGLVAAQAQPVSSTDVEQLVDYAKVTAIDPAKRIVTVVTEDRETIDIVAGPEVKNFAQIKVGDLVVAVLERSLTYTVSPRGTKIPAVMVVDQAGKAKPGEKPAGAVARSTSLSGVIVGVDTTAHTVSVVDSQGGTVHTLKVQNPERQAYLPKIHTGDILTITYTTALGLSVEPAPK
jgi:hypothetical protein